MAERLIDADVMRDDWLENGENEYVYDTNSALYSIDSQPTVDAVEVVRCKDCKHKGWIQEPCHGKSVDYCHFWDSCINDSEKDFCPYG